jgi:hypothetical protein
MLIERTVAGRTLQAECAERNRYLATDAIAAFERVGDIGAGEEIRFGFSLLRLAPAGDGLRLTEPVFESWPELRWRQTIDVTLDVTATQVKLLAEARADVEDAWFDQLLLAAPGALAERELFLRRVSPVAADDSGWLLGSLHDPEALTDAALEPVPIAHLVASRVSLLAALALPRDYVAIFVGDAVEQVLDADGNELLGSRFETGYTGKSSSSYGW